MEVLCDRPLLDRTTSADGSIDLCLRLTESSTREPAGEGALSIRAGARLRRQI